MTPAITRCVLAVVVVPFMLGCNAITDLFTGPSNVEYRASGTAARVSLTYETEDGLLRFLEQALKNYLL